MRLPESQGNIYEQENLSFKELMELRRAELLFNFKVLGS
jgi:hypothetical protein